MSTDIKTKEEVLNSILGNYTLSMLSVQDIYKAMDEWAKRFGEWLAANTQVEHTDKITLYRYHDCDGWGNYTIDDIYTVFEEEMKKG